VIGDRHRRQGQGREGEIAAVFPSKNKVIVHGVNTAKRHQKARKANEQAASSTRTCRSTCPT